MTTRTVVALQTLLRCLAPHPDGDAKSHLAGKIHGVQIGPPLPFLCKPTGRTWRMDDPDLIPPVREADGEHGRFLIPALCRCGVVTEYRVVAPEDLQRKAASEQMRHGNGGRS